MKAYTIGQFNEYTPTSMDQVSLTVRQYTPWLQRTMGDTYVIVPATPGCKGDENFNVFQYSSVPVGPQSAYRFRLPWLNLRLNAHMRHISFDLLHCHSPFSSGQYALRMARRRNIPVVTTFHPEYCRDVLQSVRSSTAKRLIRRMVKFYSSVDEVWVNDSAAEDCLREYGYRGRVIVIDDNTNSENLNDAVRYRYIAVIQHKKCELMHHKIRIPWPERIWPEPIFELNEQWV